LSLFAHALALFFAQTTPAFDRAEALLKTSGGVHSSIRVTVEGMGTVTGSYSCHQGGLQRFRIKGSGIEEEYAQSKIATVYLNHLEKEYTWYPRIPVPVEPPDESSTILQWGLPLVLAHGTLTKTAPKSKWSPLGTEIANGFRCEVLTFAQEGQSNNNDSARVWIDSSGRIQRIRFVYPNPPKYVVAVVDLIDVKYEALPLSSFEIELPWGYVPSKFPMTHQSIVTGDNAKFGELSRWPGLEKVVVDTKKPTIVLFTSDDLADQSDVSRWKSLAEKAKKEGVQFIQVWLGKEPTAKTADWNVFWDKSGEVEKMFAPPVTPYLIGIRDSIVMSGWQGWPDRNKESENLLKPLRKRG